MKAIDLQNAPNMELLRTFTLQSMDLQTAPIVRLLRTCTLTSTGLQTAPNLDIWKLQRWSDI